MTTEFAQGGAAAIPAVVSGDIDFAFGAYPSFFSAVQEGLPLLIVSEANRAAPLFAGLYSMPDSGIETPADMEGKTIAVNTLDNIVQMAVEAHLVDAGLTLDDVTLVEIAFPDMVRRARARQRRRDRHGRAVRHDRQHHARRHPRRRHVRRPARRLPGGRLLRHRGVGGEQPQHPRRVQRAPSPRRPTIAVNDEGALPEILPTYIYGDPRGGSRRSTIRTWCRGIDAEYLQIIPDFMLEQGLIDEP